MSANKSKKRNKKNGKTETITELAHRYLKDETHTTSDEELRNAKLELTGNVEEDLENLYEVDHTPVIPSTSDNAEQNSFNKDKEDDKKDKEDKEDDEDEKGTLPNPYTVLNKD